MADIFLQGVIGDEIRTQDVVDKLQGVQDVTIHLFTPGGDLFESSAIYSVLARHEGNVTMVAEGVVASGGAYVFMAADERVMDERAWMMIHNANTIAAGNQHDFREIADKIEKQQKSMVDAFVEVTGKDRSEIKELLDAETWMNAEEAVESGFADRVVESEQQVAAEIPQNVAAQFSRIPDGVEVTGVTPAGGAKAAVTKRSGANDPNDKRNQKSHSAMDLKAILAQQLNIKKDEITEAKVKELAQNANRVTDLETQLASKNDTIKDLNAKLETKNDKIEEMQAEVNETRRAEVKSEILDKAGVELSANAEDGLERRIDRYMKCEDEDIAEDIKQDAVLFAKHNGVETGESKQFNANDRSNGRKQFGKAEDFEARVMQKMEELQAKNDDLTDDQAYQKAKRLVRAEQNGQPQEA